MTSDILRNIVKTLCSHMLFEYNGKNCGIDPLSATRYDVWCGDEIKQAGSAEEVMELTIFDGKPLSEIADDITNIEL